jgi:hypothetical protein
MSIISLYLFHSILVILAYAFPTTNPAEGSCR